MDSRFHVLHSLRSFTPRESHHHRHSISGAAFAFIGIVFLLNYSVGHLNFTYGGILDQSLAAGNRQVLEIAFVAAFFGFGVKAALFPFCGWLPDASVAPTPVSALLHAVAV